MLAAEDRDPGELPRRWVVADPRCVDRDLGVVVAAEADEVCERDRSPGLGDDPGEVATDLRPAPQVVALFGSLRAARGRTDHVQGVVRPLDPVHVAKLCG